jgi:hypothetical protein
MLKSLVASWSTSLRIGLSRNSITLLRLSGWPKRQSQILFDEELPNQDSLTPAQVAVHLSHLIKEASCEGLPVEVIVSDDWMRIFIVTPPINCSRIEDCRAAANMRFQFLYGESVGEWYIEADLNPQFPFLACAIPMSLRAVLLQVASEHRLTLKSILPHFIATWNHWQSQLDSISWFGMVYDNTLTLGIVDQQRLCGVRNVPLPNHAWSDPQWLSDYILRESLRLNVPAATTLQLCGTIQSQWASKKIGSLQCIRLDGDHQNTTLGGGSPSLILATSGLQI